MYAYIKTVHEGNGNIPASELFCYELARLVHIPTPEYAILNMPDKTQAFGSVWLGASSTISEPLEAMKFVNSSEPERHIFSIMSKIFGFDLFVNNVDRHFGNYLFTDSYKRRIVLAFDFSRAWLEVSYNGFDSTKPCNTFACGRLMKSRGLLDLNLAVDTLETIKDIDASIIESIFLKMPKKWLSMSVQKEVLSWWGSEEFTKRIELLKLEAAK